MHGQQNVKICDPLIQCCRSAVWLAESTGISHRIW